MKKIIVLIYNEIWGLYEKFPEREGFEFTTDTSRLSEANVVIFHMPSLNRKDISNVKKIQGQLWIFCSMECEKHYSWQYESSILGLFDLSMTYKFDSDIPFHYLNPMYYEHLRRPPAAKKELANAFISSDFNQSNRIELLKELMTYMDVHSYGKMFNTHVLKEDNGMFTKAEIISKYKFTFAFENAIAHDYVTEKFFHPLIMGSVPVYLGAPNISEFAPHSHSFVNVNDFKSVKALADYLLYLDTNNEKYEEYLKWKEQPFDSAFEIKVKTVKNPFQSFFEALENRLELTSH